MLKKPHLQISSLYKLLSAVCLQVDANLVRPTLGEINWYAEVVSEEEMPCVICDPYYTYVVGDKVLGIL